MSDTVLIKSPEDGAQLLNDLYYQGFDGIIIKADQLVPDFFELKTGSAGEVWQIFSNRRVRLAIVGNFNYIKSKSLRDFVFESYKGNLIKFISSVEEALSGF